MGIKKLSQIKEEKKEKKGKKSNKINSVKYTEKVTTKREAISNPVAFVGSERKGYFWCNFCDTERIHNIWKESFDCLSCLQSTTFASISYREQTILFLI